ncbi:MAG TPA: polyprenyl synthetase family protein [Thermoanaerobaculia bacterium]|nr:polyprenyl synthetase family protein [Thermoanaerobaculia bacterium]
MKHESAAAGPGLAEQEPATARSPRPESSGAPGFAAVLAAFQARFETVLAEWLATRSSTLGGELAVGGELVDGVARLATAPAKRLRPALVHFTWRALAPAGAPETGVLPLALSTELLHTYLLIHDDVMDHAELRRGRSSAHAEFAHRHRERGWGGEAAEFGVATAILLGDLAHTWAWERFQAASGELAAGPRRDALAACFAAMAEEVIAGQYLEIVLAQRGDGSAEELGQVLRLKSGRYSVERPVQLGALYAAGAGGRDLDSRVLDALSRYGRALGEAFQLQDDVLGTFGEAGEVGKPVAGDLEEGKMTFLVYHALRDAAPEEAVRLRRALGRKGLTGAEAEDARAILRGSGALEQVRQMVEERVAAARAALAEAAAAGPGAPRGDGLAFLSGMVDYLAERRR